MEGYYHTWKCWHHKPSFKFSHVSFTIVEAEVCGQLLGTSAGQEGPAPAHWARQAVSCWGFLIFLPFHWNLWKSQIKDDQKLQRKGFSLTRKPKRWDFVQLDAPELAFQGSAKLGRIEYYNRLRNAKFCLAPRGESSWTLRFYEAFFVVNLLFLVAINRWMAILSWWFELLRFM